MVDGAGSAAAARRMWRNAVKRGALEECVHRVTEDVVWLPPVGDPIGGET